MLAFCVFLVSSIGACLDPVSHFRLRAVNSVWREPYCNACRSWHNWNCIVCDCIERNK